MPLSACRPPDFSCCKASAAPCQGPESRRCTPPAACTAPFARGGALEPCHPHLFLGPPHLHSLRQSPLISPQRCRLAALAALVHPTPVLMHAD
eukprot:365540-Chlamydomonas_euryale.AAC.4